MKTINNNLQYSNELQEEIVLLNTAAKIAIALVCILLIIFFITKRNKFVIKFNYSLWIKYTFLFFGIATPIIYIINSFGIYKFWSVLFVLMMLILFLMHTYIFIPKFINKKRLLIYGLTLFLSLITYTILQIRIITTKIQLYPNFYSDREGNIDNDVIAFIVGSSLLLVLFSFLYYYFDLLSKKREGFFYLFENKLVNPEVLVNVIITSLLSVPFILNVGRDSGIFFLGLFIIAIAIFYFQAFILFPKLALKNKIPLYLFINLIVISTVLIILSMVDELQFYLDSKNIDLAVSSSKVFNLIKSINIPLALNSLWLILPAGIYAASRNKVIRDKEIGYSLFRKKEAELNQLKSQVNPHFLFNSLNIIYAFALKEDSNKTADYVAKLANLMRFMITDMGKDKILVKTEIGYIKDFIDLQTIRSATKHKIDLNVMSDDEIEYTIAPMLLITFIENAFKHGLNPNKVSQLKFDVLLKNQQMEFIISNSVDKNFKSFYKEKGFGIGIENVRKRLELIYPNKHDLCITETENEFNVALKIYS